MPAFGTWSPPPASFPDDDPAGAILDAMNGGTNRSHRHVIGDDSYLQHRHAGGNVSHTHTPAQVFA